MAGKRDPEMQTFWSSLSPKIKTLLWFENRRLVLSSDEVPLIPAQQGRLAAMKTAPKFYLFTDAFCIVQGNSLTEYPLNVTWLEHIIPVEGMFHSIQNMTSFRLLFPETVLDLLCKELGHKSKWVSSIADAIGISLNCPQFISGRGDLSLDTKLEVLKSREYAEFTYRTLTEFKDGRYKGQWKNAKPHGSGEFSQETTGRLYKGSFKEGKFHGQGELHWFSEKDSRKKYIGEFRLGAMDGHGEMKYSNSDVYSGHWCNGERSGFGRIEEVSRKNSFYIGGWESDKRQGYGVYEDKMKHERYLGMWLDNSRCGPGVVVNSIGTYSEAIFTNGVIASGHDGFVIDPDGRSFMGKLGSELKLCGKGLLTLTNGTTVEGVFGGSWRGKIEITKGTLQDGDKGDNETDGERAAFAELQIARLDSRIGNCTVSASHKWEPIFKECEASLGFSGDAANDVYSAWSRLATESFHRKGSEPETLSSPLRSRRSNSLKGLHGRTVKVPVSLIPLERARALTLKPGISGLQDATKKLAHSFATTSTSGTFPLSPEMKTDQPRPEISRPINIEDSALCCSYPSGLSYRLSLSPYAPQADISESPPLSGDRQGVSSSEIDSQGGADSHGGSSSDLEDTIRDSFDLKTTIQNYVDKAFNTPSHPLGILMNRLETVYLESYAGVGANKYMLSHAIAETHSIIKRIHSIVRILFPFLSGGDRNVSNIGLSRLEGAGPDPDDYVSIESGYGIIHPLVFVRLFPTLINLYVLHHEEEDKRYLKGVNFLKEMDNDQIVRFIKFPSHICSKLVGPEVDGEMLEVLDQSSNTLRVINTLFTPGEFLEHFKKAFLQLNSIEQLSGDFLLPAIVFILIRADVPNLGSYLHFLTDFAHTKPEDEYTLVTYEAAYNFIKTNTPGQ